MIKMKFVLPLLLILGLVGNSAPHSTSAEAETLPLIVNDVLLPNVKVVERNDTLYLPFRAVFEQLGISFEYDAKTHNISYSYQEEPYAIDIREEIIYTPNGGYHLMIPLLMIEQRTYIPQDFIEDLLRIEVKQIKDKVEVRSLNYAYDKTLYSLVESYYNHDIPAKLLFTFDADPYGSLDDYDEWSPSDSDFNKVLETNIGPIKYRSLTEAVVPTSRLYENPAVSTYYEQNLHFRLEFGKWKISRMNSIHLQNHLLDDADDKVETLLRTAPAEVEKVLNDLKSNYDAINGTDAQAAIKAYSPDFIESWNKKSSWSWEDIITQSVQYPTDRRDLLEAKVIYIDDETAAVYVKVLFTELPQTFDGQYEVGELEEPYTYEEVLYLDKTKDGRWAFDTSDELDNNY